MAVSERVVRLVLALVVAGLAVGAAGVRIPQFWADGATYHAMAWSLAEDGDLEYSARDIFRIRREFPTGPQGIFLKRASGGFEFAPEAGSPWLRRVPPEQPRIYYAKAFVYPLAAAPLVKTFGTAGLLLTSAVSLGMALVLGYAELRRRTTSARALGVTLVLFLATVAPVYVIWPQPEIFNLGLITAGLVAWRWNRPVLSSVLLGIATYSKPYNLFLALPLGVEPLLARAGGRGRGLLESFRRGSLLAATVIALFGLNKVITGEMNYQGGERKTFYGTFPFEAHGVTFGNSGQWMTTDQLGPLVEGRDEATRRTGPARPPSEYRASFVRNLGYFWYGRFAGALPYYAPAFVALLVFLLLGPRDQAGWLAVAALAASVLFYILMIPDNWYGGGGTLGNRYYLNLLPLALFMVPRGRDWLIAVPALALSALLLWPVWRRPLAYSLRPVDHAIRPVFRVFPPELTMLNDLSIFTDAWRKKRPFGDTEGDPHKHWPADPKAYYLYFLDDGTSGKEVREGGEGFVLKPGARAEVVVRALEPVRRMTVRLQGGTTGGEVQVRACGTEQAVELVPGRAAALAFEPGGGFPYYDTFLYRLAFASGLTEPAFVRIALEVEKRARSSE